LNRDSGVGPVFVGGPARTPHVVLAVAFKPSATGERRVLAAEMTLRGLAAHVESLATDDTEVKLLDRKGRLVGVTRANRFGGVLAPQHLPGSHEGDPPGGDLVEEYVTPFGHMVGAYVPVTPYPFGILVEKTVAAALARVNRIRVATLLWIAISAIVGGFIARVVARRIAGRVAELAEGARQIAAGKLDVTLAVRATDELGDLAHTFNRMTGALGAARREIVKKNDEIVGWNQTLERRVEEKTRELRQAQDLLLRSRSLAALGELGSGVAHEINNPLAGVLGLAQLTLVDLPASHPIRSNLQDIEQQAMRIRRIVTNLLRFAQRQAGEDFRPVDLQRVLEDALELCGPSELDASGIQLVRHYQPKLPLIRGSATQLQEAFIQLIQNARGAMSLSGTSLVAIGAGASVSAGAGAGLSTFAGTEISASPPVQMVAAAQGAAARSTPAFGIAFPAPLATSFLGGGQLTLETSVSDDTLVRVTISDTGRGIAPEHLPRIFDPFFTTKINWTGIGLGLSLVHKTIEDHGGVIQVESEIGVGTTFRMTFPAYRPASVVRP
jgi:signal transduction histidine kinase